MLLLIQQSGKIKMSMNRFLLKFHPITSVFNLTTQVSSGLVVADFSVCFCSIVLHTSHLLGKALLLSSIPSPREVLNICVPLGDERQVTQSDQRRTWTALSPNWLCGFIYCCCTFLIQSPSTIIQRVQIHG